jgi:hypothetical protein
MLPFYRPMGGLCLIRWGDVTTHHFNFFWQGLIGVLLYFYGGIGMNRILFDIWI